MTTHIRKKRVASLFRVLVHRAALATAMLSATSAMSFADPVTIGFATAQSGWMVAYDGDARNMAQLWIEDRNKAGGLLDGLQHQRERLLNPVDDGIDQDADTTDHLGRQLPGHLHGG